MLEEGDIRDFTFQNVGEWELLHVKIHINMREAGRSRTRTNSSLSWAWPCEI